MKIGEFFVGLGLDMDNRDQLKLNDFLKGLGGVELKAIGAVGGLVALGATFRKIMGNATSAGQELFNFREQTGLSTEQLQKWSFFAEKMGSSAEEVKSSVKALSLASQQIKLGEGDFAPFQFLQIDPHQDPFAVFNDIRERIKTLEPEMARLWVLRMGISEGMLNVLKATDTEWESIKKQFALNQQQIDGLRETNKEWIELKQNIYQAGLAIGSSFAPEIEAALEGLNELTEEYNKIIKEPEKEPEKKGFLDLITRRGRVAKWFEELGSLLYGERNRRSIEGQNVSRETNISIEVNGAGNPRDVGIKVAEEVGKVISDTTYQSPKDNR